MRHFSIQTRQVMVDFLRFGSGISIVAARDSTGDDNVNLGLKKNKLLF